VAISVTANMSTISLCEDTTGWTLDDANNDNVMKIQGSYCLATQVKSTTGPTDYFTGSFDMTGKCIYVWMICNGLTDTKANGGFRIYVSDGSNTGYWYVGGGIEHLGWNCFCIRNWNING